MYIENERKKERNNMSKKKKILTIIGTIFGILGCIAGIFGILVVKTSRELEGLNFSMDDFSMED